MRPRSTSLERRAEVESILAPISIARANRRVLAQAIPRRTKLRSAPRHRKARRKKLAEGPSLTDVFQPRSDFLHVMQARGFIHQCSDFAGLDEKARSGSLVAYIGFDCTAPSLHVGSLVQIMMLHWLQETGGKPVALMGGGTTMVGDPSGKDEGRKLLTVAEIEANKAGIRKAFSHFIRFGG